MARVETYDAVIIGAGHNGLACAALLAKAGYSVAVFERADRIGGATVSVTDVWPGYTLSAASYVCSLLDPWLVDNWTCARTVSISIARIRTRSRRSKTDDRCCSAATQPQTRARSRSSIRATSRASRPTATEPNARDARSSIRFRMKSRASIASTPTRRRCCAARRPSWSKSTCARRSFKPNSSTTA